ncbi:hypothetical protein ACLB2K_064589 [Fragaria x ananassa]
MSTRTIFMWSSTDQENNAQQTLDMWIKNPLETELTHEGMYKNQLQELAQRSCFNLPSYSCIREGPDHAPRFKATVNFNGETFESPTFCTTLRQAEHAAAEVALSTLASRGPSRALAARILDETGVYKNLLQETAHRAGLKLPVYTTVRSGPGHVPVFSCTVELGGMNFIGDPARTKKQAQKNAAVAAWTSLKRLAQRDSSSPSMEFQGIEEQEQVIISRILGQLCPSDPKNPLNDRRHGQHRNTPICSNSTMPMPSLYPMQFHNWAYSSNYSSELAMYQLWQQEQLLQQQNRLLALPVLPAVASIPQIYPFMQSMLHPDHCLYFPSREEASTSVGPKITISTSGSSFCFSNHLVPNPIRGKSTVTIQEIQEEKSEESPEYSPSVVPVPFGLGNNTTELRIQEQVQDGKQKLVELGSRIDNLKLEGNQTAQSEWGNPGTMDSSFRPMDFRLQNPPRMSPPRCLRPPSAADPVLIRTVRPTSSLGSRPSRPHNLPTRFPAPPRMRAGNPSYLATPTLERREFGRPRPSFMAPAVRIRTVPKPPSQPNSEGFVLRKTAKMLLLFENPGGFMLFKVLKDDGKFTKAEAHDIAKEFETGESARKVVKLKAFSKFENMSEALEAATMLIDSKTTKDLRKFLKKHCEGEILGVADSKLGNIIKEKLKIECVHDNAVMELMRGIRSQLNEVVTGLQLQDMAPMSLGLSHSLSRYKLKFSADKVDTMVIQAIGLLDDLDKELNTYAMRVREWYGWHFPELAKIIQDNIAYARAVKLMGFRVNAAKLDFSEILSDEVETELKEAAVISMGTEISDLDLINIKELCEQVLSLAEYRAQLFDYLKTRMNTIAPNLTALVGELVGARLIAHGGSLVNLAKQPGSTIQILGAEKALFRALKTKHATPKYGLIYHASLVGQAAPKLKGKISRTLASKAVLSIRIDALREGDSLDNSVGVESRGKVEARIRSLEGKALSQSAGSAKGKPLIEAYDKDRKKGAGGLITAAKAYNPAADSVLGQTTPAGKTDETTNEKKKRKKVDDEDMPNTNDNVEPEDEEPVKKEKKKKKKQSAEDVEVQNGEVEKKKRKRKHAEEEEESEAPSKKKEKKKKKKNDD